MERRRFISPEPRLAKLLRKREPRVLPKETWEWAVDWVEDVGSVMRSRGYMVSFIASVAGYALIILISEMFPITRRLGVISQALGIAER